MYILLIVFIFALSSCTNFNKAEKSGNPLLNQVESTRLGSITVSLYDASIYDAIQLLPMDLNVIYDKNCSKKTITLDVYDMSYLDYLYSICKCINANLQRHGSVFIMTSPNDEEKKSGLLGSSVPQTNDSSNLLQSNDYTMWINLKGWKESELNVISGMNGLKWVAGDTWVYRGNIEGAVDISESIDIIRKSMHCDYYFEIYFLSSDLNLDFGSSDALGMEIDWRKTWSKGMTATEWKTVANVAFKTVADLSRSDSAKIVSGVVREGTDYNVKIGDSLPFVSRTVSDSGTVTDTDVKYETIGLNVNLRVQGSSFGIVDISIDNNDVSGYVNGYAIKHGNNMKTSYTVNGNDIRYVGSFWMETKSHGLLSVSNKSQMWDIFVKIERLSPGQYMRKNHDFFDKT